MNVWGRMPACCGTWVAALTATAILCPAIISAQGRLDRIAMEHELSDSRYFDEGAPPGSSTTRVLATAAMGSFWGLISDFITSVRNNSQDRE